MKRNFVAETDFSREEILETLALAKELNELQHDRAAPQPLRGKSVGLIFHKPSLRTRISFRGWGFATWRQPHLHHAAGDRAWQARNHS